MTRLLTCGLLVTSMLLATTGPSCVDEARTASAVSTRTADLQNRLNATNTVVKLFGAGLGTLDSYGSGVLISPEGHVITVWNHLINTGYLTAVTHTGRRYTVKVMQTNAAYDLALLQLECSDDQTFPHISLDQIATSEAGDSVYSLSNMFHVATGNEPVSIVHGVVSIRTPLQAYHGRWSLPVRDPVLIIDAITNNSGSAGGLLIHADGSPVGLIGRELRQAQSNAFVNYAVPLDTLKPVIQSMLEGRTVETPAENDGPTPLTDRQLTSQFGLTMLPNVLDRTPAFVDNIRRNSPAAMAGIQRGDLIVLVNDSVVTSVTSLQQLLATFRSGQSLQVTVNRQESLLTLTLIVP